MADAPKLNLIQKAARVMAVVEHVPKNGRNTFHNYDYATEADIVSAVRKEMAAQGLLLVPSVEKVEIGQIATKSGTERLATLTVKFTLTDGAERVEFVVLGEGQDRGDKATYKAMTGALKYALLKLFLIPTGDDPEKDEDEKPHASTAPQSRAFAVKAKVAAANGKIDPIDAFKHSALKEATALLGSETQAKAWICGVRQDPKAQRTWTDDDCAAVTAALTLLRAKSNQNGADEFGLESNP